ncbi:probable G-protein coupled receptor 139 [Carcharodon carcharias]|uniref:probable G-protein coupled receptor 139 n=1 Tax=Carcharodon carcharias TaxID=13397 RepID=UPI001B7EE05A|nr:probable G-protein coupled receptor 139 [Carcharodon carcharias]
MHGPVKGLFFAIYYPTLAAIGVPANLLGIVILARGRCALSRCITYYLLAIAVADFLVIITAVTLNRIGGIYFRLSVLSTTPACKLSAMLVFATWDVSVWLTVAFTFDRFVAICCHGLKTRYCTKETALLVIGLAYDWLDHILTPFLPFLLILLLNALTVRHILAASRTRRKLRGAESHGDQEMINRKRSIVLLFAISLSFLLLWVTYVGHFFYVRITGDAYFTGLDFNDPDYILQETTNMLHLLSSCNNVFIYAVAQNKFREELRKVMIYPFATLTSCFKR